MIRISFFLSNNLAQYYLPQKTIYLFYICVTVNTNHNSLVLNSLSSTHNDDFTLPYEKQQPKKTIPQKNLI